MVFSDNLFKDSELIFTSVLVCAVVRYIDVTEIDNKLKLSKKLLK